MSSAPIPDINTKPRITDNVGGPPVVQINPSQLTCNDPLFTSMQNAAEGCCASEGTGPLCAALAAGQVWGSEPFNALVDLIVNYSGCREELTPERKQAAWKAFSDVTGLKSQTFNASNSITTNTFHELINLNSFYMFFPVLILLIIAVWFMVGFGWINWVTGLFFTVLIFVVLYLFSVLYRLHGQSIIRRRSNELVKESESVQSNIENSVPYWPQGLFAVASSITSPNGKGWKCNNTPDNNCPPCNKVGTRSTRNKKMVQETSEYDDESEPAPRPRRRTTRRS